MLVYRYVRTQAPDWSAVSSSPGGCANIFFCYKVSLANFIWLIVSHESWADVAISFHAHRKRVVKEQSPPATT